MRLSGTEVLPLKTMLQLCWRSWQLRKIRRRWRDGVYLRKIAKARGWDVNLFDIEWDYLMVRMMAKALKNQELGGSDGY